MTFLKLKFVFFRKVKYILLYLIKQVPLSLIKKIKTNFLKIHNEKILLFNRYKKKKKFFFINLYINKKICLNCKKILFIKKIYYKKNT
ncbi:MAG: hypothetical protein NVS84_00725 [Candidatus Carsonella ruddii]|nr:MAG: hypothetical protein NVS84_00725 [Candidatus Carsonella ruddii]WMC19392.1 MAG: hypothetical protein NVS85_00725 [Candidatus Carsonella ruddii]